MKNLILSIWSSVDPSDKVKLATAYLGTTISLSTTIEIVQIIAGLAAAAASISVVYKNLKKEK